MGYSAEKKKFWRKTIKDRAVEAFGGKCVCCGQEFDSVCFDFHHINPEEKELSMSSGNFNGAKTWLLIRDELKKCALVCSNCHRLIHAGIIPNPTESTFNEEYYEWDLVEYNQVNNNLEPIDKSHICPQCGGKKITSAELCTICSHKAQKQFEVTREELKNLIRTESFASLGRQFGVSDNAIKKRCRTLNLPYKKSDINKYTDEEWKLV